MHHVVEILQKPEELFNSVISFPSSHLFKPDNHKKGDKSASSFSAVTTSSHSSIQYNQLLTWFSGILDKQQQSWWLHVIVTQS